MLVLLLQTFVYLYFLLGFNESFDHFQKKENKGNYRPVHNKLKILFNSTTSVSKFSGFDHSIPQSQFEFATYGTIASHCYDTTYLTGNFNCFTSQASTFIELKKNAIHNLILTLI